MRAELHTANPVGTEYKPVSLKRKGHAGCNHEACGSKFLGFPHLFPNRDAPSPTFLISSHMRDGHAQGKILTSPEPSPGKDTRRQQERRRWGCVSEDEDNQE